MVSTICYEFRRLFNGLLKIIPILLVVSSLFSTFFNVKEYIKFQENKTDFLTAERSKLNFYLSYEQYGATGFRIMLEPSPLSVFFNGCNFTQDMEGMIDTSEVIKIYNGRKGKKAFSLDDGFGDLNFSISVFGTLIMIIMGFVSFPNTFYIEYFNCFHWKIFNKIIFVRIMLMNMFFLCLLAAVYSLARGLGVFFTGDENLYFIIYGLAALWVLDGFFLLGLVIKGFYKYKKNSLYAVIITWAIFVFCIPGSAGLFRSIKTIGLSTGERLDTEKLKTLLDNEFHNRAAIADFFKKNPKLSPESPESPEFQNLIKTLYQNYMQKVYLKNKEMEAALLQKVKRDMELFSFVDNLSPVTFLNRLSAEASGKGYEEYLEFVGYVIALRDEFMKFYGEKRYGISTPKKPVGVDSFIKTSQNIYRSRAHLPGDFKTGMVLMGIYVLILVGLANRLGREEKIPVEPPEIPGNTRHGQLLFLLVNGNKQEEITYAFRQGKRSWLHRESHLTLCPEVSARTFIDYACRNKKIKRHHVMENLELLEFNEYYLGKKISKYSEENRQKLICSLVFAEANEVIIINDFIRGASAGFEKQFLELVSRVQNSGRKIVYFSDEIYSPNSSFIPLDINLKTYHPFELDPQQVSLR